MPKSTEKRTYARYEYRIPVEAAIGDREISGLTVNLSLGGMLLQVAEPLPFGTRLRLRFRLPALDSDTEVYAAVRWVTKTAMGVQFESLRARDVWGLNRLFENLSVGSPGES